VVGGGVLSGVRRPGKAAMILTIVIVVFVVILILMLCGVIPRPAGMAGMSMLGVVAFLLLVLIFARVFGYI
jgi:hypothetical protein